MMQKGVIRTTLWKFFNPKNGRSFYQWIMEWVKTKYRFLSTNISTDYVGHALFQNSIEIEDTYLRLDRDLEVVFQQLDKK